MRARRLEIHAWHKCPAYCQGAKRSGEGTEFYRTLLADARNEQLDPSNTMQSFGAGEYYTECSNTEQGVGTHTNIRFCGLTLALYGAQPAPRSGNLWLRVRDE